MGLSVDSPVAVGDAAEAWSPGRVARVCVRPTLTEATAPT